MGLDRLFGYASQLADWFRQHHLTWLDWLIIAGYCAATLIIGFYFTRRSGKNMTDYFVSGRSMPWWLLGTSMIATTFAADTPLAVTSDIRKQGIWAEWFWFSLAVGQLLTVFSFSGFWRRAEVLTDNQLIEMRYSGKPAAALRGFKAALFATVFNLIVMGWVLTAIGDVSEVIIGIPKVPAIVIFSVITVVYCTAGGLWAVAATDLFQFALAMAGMVVLAFYAVSAVGGLDALRAAVAGDERMNFFPPMGGGAGIGTPLFGFLMFVLVRWWATHNADGGGYLIQRMAAAKDERHSRLGTLWFVIGLYAVRLWPWVIVAAVSLVLFPVTGDAAVDAELDRTAFPLVMKQVLTHPGLLGLMVTAFIGAFMSTIDTHLNWGASYIINDIYRRFFVKDASERHYVKVSYVANLVILALAGVVAANMGTIRKAWEFVGAMGAGVGAFLILRWFWWRINAWTEIAALSASVAVTGAFEVICAAQNRGAYKLFETPAAFAGIKWGFPEKLLVIIPVSFAAGMAATYLTEPTKRERLVEFFRKVRPSGAWGDIPVEAGVTPAGLSERGVAAWLASVGFIYCLTFGIGKLLFGPVYLGWTLLCDSAVFGWLAWSLARDERRA